LYPLLVLIDKTIKTRANSTDYKSANTLKILKYLNLLNLEDSDRPPYCLSLRSHNPIAISKQKSLPFERGRILQLLGRVYFSFAEARKMGDAHLPRTFTKEKPKSPKLRARSARNFGLLGFGARCEQS